MHYFGINRQRLDEILRSLGGYVESVRRTGEVRYVHPLVPERPRADGRRKDAPKQLVSFVCKLEKLLVEKAANDEKWRHK